MLPLGILVCLIIGTMIDLKELVILLIFKSCCTNELDVSSYSKSLDSSEESEMGWWSVVSSMVTNFLLVRP